jgi:DNA-binding NarL/FixJ family response regulator
MSDRLRVVMIDDSTTVLDTLTHYLSAVPEVEVVGTAKTGEEAVRLVMQDRPDLAFLELVVPGMDGHAAIRTLRKLVPEMRVVVLSSTAGNPDARVQLERLGAAGIVSKPFDEPMIREAIDGELAFKHDLGQLSAVSSAVAVRYS